jgi:hypothetical protein
MVAETVTCRMTRLMFAMITGNMVMALFVIMMTVNRVRWSVLLNYRMNILRAVWGMRFSHRAARCLAGSCWLASAGRACLGHFVVERCSPETMVFAAIFRHRHD